MTFDPDDARRRVAQLAALEARLSFRISRLSKLLDGHAAKTLAGSGLPLSWYRILTVLDIFGEISAADVSRVTAIDPGQISRSVAAMTGKGLLSDRPDPASQRRKLLSLAPAGKAALTAVAPLFRLRQEKLTAHLSEAERNALNSAIDKLTRLVSDDLEAKADL